MDESLVKPRKLTRMERMKQVRASRVRLPAQDAIVLILKEFGRVASRAEIDEIMLARYDYLDTSGPFRDVVKEGRVYRPRNGWYSLDPAHDPVRRAKIRERALSKDKSRTT